MHHYLLSALIFKDGYIRDGVNCTFRSEKPATIVDFRNHIAQNYAGPRETYSAIIIPMYNEISEEFYNENIKAFSEEELQNIVEK